jgi:D-amino-acid dehydrogenase
VSTSVLVIGAGVIGLNVALACARRGWSVSVIDRAPQQRDGCSFGNAGMIVPSHFTPLAAPGMVALGLRWMWNPASPFYIKPRANLDLLRWGWQFCKSASRAHVEAAAPVLRDFGLLSRQEFTSLGLDCGLQKRGLLMLCKTSAALAEEVHTATKSNALGIPADVLDARGTAALDPAVTMDVCGSVHYPLDCHLNPQQLMRALEAELLARGVQFHWQTDITGFNRKDRSLHSVSTSCGEMKADEVVLCSGVWSTEMAQSLELSLPMQAGKGYSLTLTQPRQLPALCSICTEARLAVTPMNGTLRVGGTMELAGHNTRISQRRVSGITHAFPSYFPEFQPADFAGVQPWTGLRPLSPDGLPYLGRSRRWQNLVIATGHAMMGLSLAPATGKVIAELLAHERPSIPLTLLSPDRFSPS